MLKILLFAGCLYLLFVAFVYLTQQRMLYFPNVPGRELTSTPADIGLDYEEVAFQASDGVRLHGWWVPAPDPGDPGLAGNGGADSGDGGPRPRTLLFFHGNAGNISHRLDSIRQFHALGLAVLIVDYRGYGRSEGSPSEQGTYRDAEAAWRHLTETRGLEGREIVLFGRSLGASVAAWLAAHLTADTAPAAGEPPAPAEPPARAGPAALIVEAAFSSVPDLGSALYPYLPVRLLSRFDYATRDYVAAARCPVLVVHSRGDEIVPFSQGREIHAAAESPAPLLELRGSHNTANLESEAHYLDGLRSFLEEHATPE